MSWLDIKGKDAFTANGGASSLTSANWTEADFNVAYGSGSIATGGAMPPWVWIAAAGLTAWWLWNRRRR